MGEGDTKRELGWERDTEGGMKRAKIERQERHREEEIHER